MKTIGLIGGMSWESSALYYAAINREVRKRLGGTHSAKSLMVSLDFDEIERLQHAGEWDGLSAVMASSARKLEAGGADFIVLCTNTMHRLADAIEEATLLPLLHIADPTAAAIKSAGMTRIGLLGTAFTMEQAFYKERLARLHGIEVVIPEAEDRETVHRVIYEELVQGVVRGESRDAYLKVMERLGDAGAQGIILGCTEIVMLLGDAPASMPMFDTTALHANAAVDFALRVNG